MFFVFLVSDMGQQKYGGWTQEGKERFVELRNLIKTSKKATVEMEGENDDEGNPVTVQELKVKLVEEATLEELQKRYATVGPQLKPKKRKREVEELEVAFDDDDE